jgi:predicted alpha/beta-hydrolase family hydrolase
MGDAQARHLLLAPGASGNAAAILPYLAAATAVGWSGSSVSLPRGRSEAAVAAYRRAMPATGLVITGGQSFGGRVASLLAAEEASRPAGLVLLCYPLHPPGAPQRATERTAHWPRIGCPVLLLSGDRDPFARIDLLRPAVGLLPDAELVLYPGVGHGLRPVLDDALERVRAFLARLAGEARTAG